MASRDYYEILGVPKTATGDEIRKGYRKLARQYHPDVNKAADAHKKFTEVQNAYDVLSDDKKRATYDQFGPAAFETGSAQEAASRARSGGPHYNWQNVGQPGSGGKTTINGVDFDPEDMSSIFESVFGARPSGFGDAPPRPGGKRRAGQRRAHPAPEEEAPPIEREIEIDFMTAAVGGVQNLRLSGDAGAARTVEVKIPAGIETGRQLRIRAGADGADILLTVKVKSHPWFRRGEFEHTGKGLDLYLDLPVSFAEAAMGASVSVPTLKGTLELTIPPGTPSGRKLRLRSKGIHDPKGHYGDLYAIVKIIPPTGAILTEPEVAALRAISAKGGPYRPW